MTDLKSLIMVFIGVIVGISLLVSAANSATDATELKTVTNESVALVNNTATSLANNQLVTFTRLGNDTTTLDTPADYTVNLQQGQITFLTGNASVADGTYDASYTYRNVGNSSARTLVNLVIIFGALAILFIAIAGFVPGLQNMLRK